VKAQKSSHFHENDDNPIEHSMFLILEGIDISTAVKNISKTMILLVNRWRFCRMFQGISKTNERRSKRDNNLHRSRYMRGLGP
jgi:hypothetical protein